VGRNDALVISYPELVENRGGVLHHLPVGFAAHDDGNHWLLGWQKRISSPVA
jgi:hypothetical protein